MFNNCFFKNRTVHEIIQKNMVEWGKPHITIWRMRIAFWIPQATHTHSEYVVLIAFPLQRLHERALLLRYTYTACLVIVYA